MAAIACLASSCTTTTPGARSVSTCSLTHTTATTPTVRTPTSTTTARISNRNSGATGPKRGRILSDPRCYATGVSIVRRQQRSLSNDLNGNGSLRVNSEVHQRPFLSSFSISSSGSGCASRLARRLAKTVCFLAVLVALRTLSLASDATSHEVFTVLSSLSSVNDDKEKPLIAADTTTFSDPLRGLDDRKDEQETRGETHIIMEAVASQTDGVLAARARRLEELPKKQENTIGACSDSVEPSSLDSVTEATSKRRFSDLPEIVQIMHSRIRSEMTSLVSASSLAYTAERFEQYSHAVSRMLGHMLMTNPSKFLGASKTELVSFLLEAAGRNLKPDSESQGALGRPWRPKEASELTEVARKLLNALPLLGLLLGGCRRSETFRRTWGDIDELRKAAQMLLTSAATGSRETAFQSPLLDTLWRFTSLLSRTFQFTDCLLVDLLTSEDATAALFEAYAAKKEDDETTTNGSPKQNGGSWWPWGFRLFGRSSRDADAPAEQAEQEELATEQTGHDTTNHVKWGAPSKRLHNQNRLRRFKADLEVVRQQLYPLFGLQWEKEIALLQTFFQRAILQGDSALRMYALYLASCFLEPPYPSDERLRFASASLELQAEEEKVPGGWVYLEIFVGSLVRLADSTNLSTDRLALCDPVLSEAPETISSIIPPPAATSGELDQRPTGGEDPWESSRSNTAVASVLSAPTEGRLCSAPPPASSVFNDLVSGSNFYSRLFWAALVTLNKFKLELYTHVPERTANRFNRVRTAETDSLRLMAFDLWRLYLLDDFGRHHSSSGRGMSPTTTSSNDLEQKRRTEKVGSADFTTNTAGQQGHENRNKGERLNSDTKPHSQTSAVAVRTAPRAGWMLPYFTVRTRYVQYQWSAEEQPLAGGGTAEEETVLSKGKKRPHTASHEEEERPSTYDLPISQLLIYTAFEKQRKVEVYYDVETQADPESSFNLLHLAYTGTSLVIRPNIDSKRPTTVVEGLNRLVAPGDPADRRGGPVVSTTPPWDSTVIDHVEPIIANLQLFLAAMAEVAPKKLGLLARSADGIQDATSHSRNAIYGRQNGGGERSKAQKDPSSNGRSSNAVHDTANKLLQHHSTRMTVKALGERAYDNQHATVWLRSSVSYVLSWLAIERLSTALDRSLEEVLRLGLQQALLTGEHTFSQLFFFLQADASWVYYDEGASFLVGTDEPQNKERYLKEAKTYTGSGAYLVKVRGWDEDV